MRLSYTGKKIILFLILSVTYAALVSFNQGIVGFTMKSGNKLGCVCHNLDPDQGVTVTINGPSSVFAGDSANYILRITGGPAIAGGCDIASSAGDVYPSYLDASLRRDEQFPGAGFELTHIQPKPFNSGTVEFTFKYIAPAAPNTTDTLFGTGNSTNLDMDPDRDKWNFSEHFVVNILERPLPVELSAFTSSVRGNTVELRWTTLMEENNEGFDIERKSANGNWLKAGFVEGRGNSTVSADYLFTDRNLSTGEYNYRLRQVDYNGNHRYYNLEENIVIGVPENFVLHQNYPNPFNPSTKITFDLPESGIFTLDVYDAMGRHVARLLGGQMERGFYSLDFNAGDLASGVYYLRLSNGVSTAVKQLMLLK